VIKKIVNINQSEPYKKFLSKYNDALNANQKNIEAFLVSSFNEATQEVDARFVNLKFIINDEWIFFSNYNSPKAQQFLTHNQISSVFYWPNINTQIRIKSKIGKSSKEISDNHFYNRNKEKNALAISSKQSEKIISYDDVIKNYKNILEANNLNERPKYWGGFSFSPYYFEFWEGHNSRLNKRDVYEKAGDSWNHYIVQP